MSLKPMSRKSWTLEDVLLFDHWQQQGGLVFSGVIAEGRGVGWPAEPGPRRIGAVRVPAAGQRNKDARLVDWSADGREEMWRAVSYAGCEVLVAGRRLSRALIGEAVSGAELLRMTAPVHGVRPVILCVQPETTLLEACHELGVGVWQPAWANQSILAEAFDGYAMRSHPPAAEAARRRARLEAILEEYRTLRDPAVDLSALAARPAAAGEAGGAANAPRRAGSESVPSERRVAPTGVEASGPSGCDSDARAGVRPARAVPLERWRERRERAAEDVYLLERWRKEGGLQYSGVALPVGGPHRRWRRSADGGRIGALQALAPAAGGEVPDLVPYTHCRPGELDALVAGDVRVVRAGLALTRALLGEVVAGAALLARAYRPPSVRPTVLCDEVTPLLERVCERLSVDVWRA